VIELRGISWDHPRGHDPMVATARDYMRAHPDVDIVWQTRSLQDFADYPIEKLAERADLVLIDHPFVGIASDVRCFLPLEVHADRFFLADLAANSVGPSHASYFYGGHQWALAIDAACQVSAYRPDLIERCGGVPRTWDEVLALAANASRRGAAAIAIPTIPVDTIMSFLSICHSLGETPFSSERCVVGREGGVAAWTMLKRLVALSHPESTMWNPILTLERMSRSDEIVYAPLLFGYSNYARPEFRPHLIRFSGIPQIGGSMRGGILGGVGLAVSARTSHPMEAVDYAKFVASGQTQRGIYYEAGGQPAHRTAWTDVGINNASNGFFSETLQSIDRAYLRPRYPGFLEVQDAAGRLLHKALLNDSHADPVLDELDDLYANSRLHAAARS
jgi:multiple sugar transport system substrate-binding protein